MTEHLKLDIGNAPVAEATKTPKKKSKKVKREIANILNKDMRTRERLIRMNPYSKTLLDPFNYRGVRIPDDQQYESIPFTVVDRRTLTVNALGIAGVCYGFRASPSAVSKGSLIPVLIASDAVGSYSAGMIFGTAATSADLTLGTLGTTGVNDIKFTSWQASNPAVPNLFDKVRLVSAAVNVQCTANFSNNQGKYTGAAATRNYSRAQSGNGYPITYVQNLPKSRTVPISNEKGITVRYSPVDDISRQYVTIGNNQSTNGPIPFSIPNGSGDWEQNTSLAAAVGGELWVAIDGASTTATFLVTASFNYEGIPDVNNVLFSAMNSLADVSDHDPIAYIHGQTVSNSAPQVIGSSQSANGEINEKFNLLNNLPANGMDVPKSASSFSMFDSLLNVIDKAPQILAKVPELVEKGGEAYESLSPMLESALAFLA